MFNTSALLALAAAILVKQAVSSPLANAPTTDPSCSPGASQNASFEDVPGAVPGIGLTALPIPYKGLYYQGFNDADIVRTGVAPGLYPHSGSNYAVSDVVSKMDQGTPMLTVYYTGSNVKSFDLKSFYFGCTLNLMQAAADPPTECLIQFTGYKGSDNQADGGAVQTCGKQFHYIPSTMTGAQQMSLENQDLSCFTGVQYIIITFELPGGMAALDPATVLILDDVIYTTHTC